MTPNPKKPMEVFVNIKISKNEVTPWENNPVGYKMYHVCHSTEPGAFSKNEVLFREVLDADYDNCKNGECGIGYLIEESKKRAAEIEQLKEDNALLSDELRTAADLIDPRIEKKTAMLSKLLSDVELILSEYPTSGEYPEDDHCDRTAAMNKALDRINEYKEKK